MSEWLSGILVIAGATLALLAGVGVLRMPDVFTRMQASTKASTLGLGCLLAGLAIRHPDMSFVVRAGSIAAFMMLTTAVAAHVIARAAAISGSPLWKGTLIDERGDGQAARRGRDASTRNTPDEASPGSSSDS